MKTQRGTIKEMTVRSLVQSHPYHQVRFNNPARRSDAPTGITETKRKLLGINNFEMKKETQETQGYIQDKYSQIEFLPVQRNKLPYNMLD